MNFIELESEQKLRGGFYTEPAIANFLVRWIKAIKPKKILEPSCGDGAFLDAIEKNRLPDLETLVACEIDSIEAAIAAKRTRLNAKIENTDFLTWYLSCALSSTRFDAVVGNPPFIRYQYLPEEQQLLAEKIFSLLNLPFTRHTNAWVPFVLASINLLKPGGRLAMVIPSEIFHIPHASSLRKYLKEQCARVLIFDPQEIWFEETLQGTVLLLAEKKKDRNANCHGVAVVSVNSRKVLDENPEDYFQKAEYTNGDSIIGKWMPLFLSQSERSLISSLRTHEKIHRFNDVAKVDVGIVTGANKFFLVPDSVVEKFELQRWAHPMFGRSDHAKGLVFTSKDHVANRCDGLPANFLWFDEDEIKCLPKNVRNYLQIGLDQKLHTRFKCRTRKTWYKVPSVYSAPVAMLKRAHHYPRLILNRANAYTTDTAYRIQVMEMRPAAFVLGFVNSLTCLTAEMEGRHYGGGVLELVPSEIERLLVPSIEFSVSDLNSADRRFRKMQNDTEFLREQDLLILGRLGLTSKDQTVIHQAWLKLRDRRHRTNE